MKNFTKTLVAATMALGAVSANAAIVNDNSANAEAWLSVYDSTSANTFTLDLGVAGLTWGALFADKAATGTLATVNLSPYADWNAFKTSATLATTKYAVAVGGELAGSKKAFMVTGADNDFFQGVSAPAVNTGNTQINVHALNINSDQLLTPTAETSFVNDADATLGAHGNSAGMWDGASYDVDSAYGQSADFNLVTLVTANRRTSAIHEVFAAQWKLDGDTLTLASDVSAVPVPAAVWMFGSALLGLTGISRKRKSV